MKNTHMRRFAIFAPLVPAALMLSACGDTTEAPPADELIEEATDPNTPEGIQLTDAYVRLPAVNGRPGVAYFNVVNNGDAVRNIASVSLKNVGRTEMHRTMQEGGVSSMEPVTEIAVQPGQTVAFEQGGYHVMLFDLAPAMMARTTADLTVTFDNGDKASFAAPILKPGESPGGLGDSDEMGGMEAMR
ncbi:copper chaperone PCu(A)C [uncultured Croceicoccus sp.]|uniref:copper chaperone PCu(A)C n=1 Tax=uncultured Croceicoccus sp. TaxID=1295329 RepID=UPI002608AF6D|nr:copper chaperone PCu(A)C [uncultured Croceicoccus sp.]